MKKIGIIGGGASGLAAAITAAKQKDTEVYILEHKEQAGKKLLSTGNGRCNLTNEKMDSSFFRSSEIKCVEAVLEQFGYEDAIHFFEELGLMMRKRNGYIYPRCEQAAVVRELLVREAERLGVKIYTGVHVTEVFPGRKGFKISACQETFSADRVILACGGCAAKVLGSDGSGYRIAKSLGHSLVPVVPALVQLKIGDNPLKAAAGVRTEASVSAYVDGNNVASDTGELQITDYGISGIPVFQISRYIGKALYKKQKAKAAIDFLPSMEEAEFAKYLMKRLSGREKMKAADFLEEDIRRFTRQCKHTVLSIQDTRGFDNAQVCAGGVSLQEIDWRTMESCYVKGLYLTGELLDADGMCGGYNLQWAWASGALAGRAAGNL